jgi:hypothetical protein
MKFNVGHLRPVSPCLFVLVPHLKATDGNQKEIQKKNGRSMLDIRHLLVPIVQQIQQLFVHEKEIISKFKQFTVFVEHLDPSRAAFRLDSTVMPRRCESSARHIQSAWWTARRWMEGV